MSDDAQHAVIAFLADPATHGGAKVTRIDTHAAVVFLAARRALKIKRNVRFPFLDFSTLEKRKSACEAELAINRAFAPALYRRVLAVTRETGGNLALDGDGTPVEWALEMSRFDETHALDHLADAGRIDAGLADALGRTVAAAHATARPVANFGFANRLTEIVEQNEQELLGFAELFDPAAVNTFTARSREALARLRPLLTAREADGLVRRCHGDLHLGNIVLIENAPVLFDAIEFDERMAIMDVFYDLAFLLMDLIERGLGSAADIVLNRYLTETRRDSDLDALAALPLFMATRAAIRAKVTASHTAQSARAYFALAQQLIDPPSPRLIAVGGLSGTGKSVLARSLASAVPPLPGAVVLRSDVERKALFGVAETEPLPPNAYRMDATQSVYALLGKKAQRVLAAGHSAVVDAVFARADERAAVEAAADDAPFHGLFLTTDLATRVARVSGRSADASDADAEVARAQEDYGLGELSWEQVDASGTPDETRVRALAVLKLA
jgi:hypothetical protein